GLATARELRAVGINTDFAPVLDVNNNPANPVIGVRSFGERVEEVTRLGMAALAGLREGGVLTCAKHFPGHGDTDVDTHFGLPALAHDPARLRAVELPPFKAAIDAGVPLVMTTHIVFAGLDGESLPATLSPRILRQLLRDELGFDGVIVSDALVMKAIADRWGVAEGTVRFLEAGGDLALATRQERQVHAAILDAVRSGRIPREQIAASVARVARVKAWIAAQPPADPAWVGAPEHKAWTAACARDALTLIRDDAHRLPLRRDARLAVIDCAYEWTFGHAYELPKTSALVESLRLRFPSVQGVVVDGRALTEAQRVAAHAAVTEADIVLLATRGANRFPAQAEFARDVLGWGKPVVTAALNEPYDLLAYPAAATALATYGDDPVMIAALGAALAGEAMPGGRLPVSLPGLYPVGHRADESRRKEA
ncbi:MAG: glycoside hydrolase family 3 N-terminal domain-containing protein, partial [Thermomicrobiales bacterium]